MQATTLKRVALQGDRPRRPASPPPPRRPNEDRAAAIARLRLRDDGALLEELLIELEEKEWARQAAIEALRSHQEPAR
jgi:hypothetical protein